MRLNLGSDSRKPVSEIIADGRASGLRRTLRWPALLAISISSTVGAGIFVTLREVIPMAGPSVIIAFVVGAVAMGLSVFAFAELGTAIPGGGSSYTYAYAALGEPVAWLTGCLLFLTYGVASSAVAVGWGDYTTDMLGRAGLELPFAWATSVAEGGILDVPALVVIALCVFLLVGGTQQSARVNLVFVIIKIAILLIFAASAAMGIQAGNYSILLPMGLAGAAGAAGTVFFNFSGLESATTAGDEAVNPRRDLPIALIGALIVVTVLYVIVSVVAVGAAMPVYFELGSGEAFLSDMVADVQMGGVLPWIVGLGAVAASFSFVLVALFALTRILFTMSQDGLLPPFMRRVNPRTGTPVRNTIVVAGVVAVISQVLPERPLFDVAALGTLLSLIVVNVALIVLRRSEPTLDRPFRARGVPAVPILAIILLSGLCLGLAWIDYVATGVFLVAAMAVYLAFARRGSRLRAPQGVGDPTT